MKNSLIETYISSNQPRLKYALLLAVFACLNITIGTAQDCDEVTIACNDSVQASLNQDCEVHMTYDMIVEEPYAATYDHDGDLGAVTPEIDAYAIEYQDEDGNPIVDASGAKITFLGQEHIGSVIKLYTTYLPCNVSCWGNVVVEDKFPPQIITCADITVDCETPYDTLSLKNNTDYFAFYRPDVDENCGGESYEVEDIPSAFLCEGGYAKIESRVWNISDNHGNAASCIQRIFVTKGDLDDIVFPDHYEVDVDVDTPCSAFNVEGIDPSVSGAPSHYTCPNFDWMYMDTPFDLCGVSTKVLRMWFVIDWCTGETMEVGQYIEAIDDIAPVKTCPPDTIFAGSMSSVCGADINLDPKNLDHLFGGVQQFFECSEYEIFVEYLLAVPGTDQPAEDGEYTSEGVVELSNGTFDLPELPLGPTWVRYRYRDVCGNESGLDNDPDFGSDDTGSCYFEIVVEDTADPYAICEGFTKLTLNADGFTQLNAASLDDSSLDNCTIDSFEIKRFDGDFCTGYSSDVIYGEHVTFCCADGSRDSIPVMLKVYDLAGNSDECVGYVCVTGGEDLSVTCPTGGPYPFDCDEPYENGTYPDVSDYSATCDVSLDFTTIFNENLTCGTGTVFRITDVTIAGTNTLVKRCSLTLNVTYAAGFDATDIECQGDIMVPGCNANTHPDIIGGKPEITNNSNCIDVVMSHKDEDMPVDYTSNYCYTFKRLWTIIDWCNYDIDNPEDNVYYCEQLIHVNSDGGPKFTTSCSDLTIEAEANSCEAEINLEAIAEDEDGCTANDAIVYEWMFDEGDNGTYDHMGDGNSVMGTYAVGTHKVKFTATDDCNNTSMCMFEIEITGEKAPTPICIAHLIYGLGDDGEAAVWASEFNIKSEAGCGNDLDLEYSFSTDPDDFSRVFTCDHLDNGVGQSFNLQMYVHDSYGQYEFCEVRIEIQDNKDVCLDVEEAAQIQGKVYSEDYIGLENFEVELHEQQDASMQLDYTDVEGDYEFSSVDFYDSYLVDPENDRHPLNGVSTLDIVMIQQHILGIKDLDSPYKIIAADANSSNSVSAQDITEIRRLILGVNTEFTHKDSWVFVNANHTFIDPTTPWNYTDVYDIQSMYVNITNAEFIAVKTGDVNQSVMEELNGLEIENRSAEKVMLQVEDQAFNAGDMVDVDFAINSDINMVGMQYTFNFDADMFEFVAAKKGMLAIQDYNLGLVNVGDGQITVSVDQAQGAKLVEGNIVYSFTLKALKDGVLNGNLDITSDITKTEIYNSNNEVMELGLEIRNELQQVSGEFTLYQNEPNPFADITLIPFYNPSDRAVSLTIFDAAGRTLYQVADNFSKGFKYFEVNANELDKNGVLFYRVEANGFTAMKKMVILK